MEKSLVFKKESETLYVSDPIKLTSDAGIEIVFPDASDKREITISQSFSGENWSVFDSNPFAGKVFVRLIEGVPAVGVFIRVKASVQPVSAKIFSE